jgi:hypothetical protein
MAVAIVTIRASGCCERIADDSIKTVRLKPDTL